MIFIAIGTQSTLSSLFYILKQHWCLSVCGDKQGRVGQGRHPPTVFNYTCISRPLSSSNATRIVSRYGCYWMLPIYQAHAELQVQGVRQGFSSCLEKGWCLSLCGQKLGSAWKILPVTARSLWWQTGQGRGRAGRPGQPLQGVERGAISILKILGENRGTCI